MGILKSNVNGDVTMDRYMDMNIDMDMVENV